MGARGYIEKAAARPPQSRERHAVVLRTCRYGAAAIRGCAGSTAKKRSRKTLGRIIICGARHDVRLASTRSGAFLQIPSVTCLFPKDAWHVFSSEPVQ